MVVDEIGAVEIDELLMIMVTFVVPGDHDVIGAINDRWEETKSSLTERRKRQVRGQEVIGLTEDCSVATLFEDLTQAGFKMVWATTKRLVDGRWQVRLEFVPYEDFENRHNKEFEQVRGKIEEMIILLSHEALWTMQGCWKNQFFLNGEPVGYMASIVFKGRKPLFQPSGESVTKWRTDEFGQRIGDGPMPIAPEHQLRIVDGTIQLVPA